MALLDIIEKKRSTATNTTTVTHSFTSTPSEGNLILLFCSARGSTVAQTVATPPSGFTVVQALNVGAGFVPGMIVYGKVAGASESNSYQIIWDYSVTGVQITGYEIEGTLSLSEVFGDATCGEDVSADKTDDVPASALSTTAGNGLAIYCSHTNSDSSADHTADNGFSATVATISSVDASLYGDKVITHPDTDIQTTLNWTAESSTSAFAMVLVEPTTGGATITSTDTPVARGGTNVAINGSSFGATQGTGGVTYGGEVCSIDSWSDTLINVTIPTTIALQHDATGYTFIVVANDATSDTSAAVPFNAPAGWDYTDLVSPVTTEGSILFGYTGDTPVTGDQAVYTTPTDPDSIGFTVGADGEWVLDSMPTANQTISVYVIQADGTIGTTGTVTYSVDADGRAVVKPVLRDVLQDVLKPII